MGWNPVPPPKNATAEDMAEYREMLVSNLRLSWLGRRALRRLESERQRSRESGGSSGQADEPDAPTHETHPDGAQRLATTDTAGGGHSEKGKDGKPVVVGTTILSSPARPTFTDPGDGYDSAIRWHADFERGNI